MTHVKLCVDYVRMFRVPAFVFPLNSFIPRSALLMLCLAASAPLSAQEVELPPFDSFSYLNDPLFNPPRAGVMAEPVAEQSKAAKNTDKPGKNNSVAVASNASSESLAPECPVIEPAAPQTGLDEFETRLAIDKALSQILKLTVDYSALRNRVSGLTQRSNSDGWLGSTDGNPNSERQLEALQALNQKQLDDRDKQIKLLKTRLDAVQKRYDNENVARLLAEKRLKVARDGVKKNNAKVTKTNRKVQALAEQLEQNQSIIRQLKIDLTDAQLAIYKQGKGSQQGGSENIAPAASAPASNFASPTQEWVVDGLEFEEGSAEIKLASTANLDKLLAYLLKNPDMHIQINGYTDSIGSAVSNLKLSQARAEAVAHYLQQKGANRYQIKVLGYGERRPLADNETEAGRKLNRRVAILFLP